MAEKNLIGELDMYREAGIKPNFSDIAKRYGKDRHTVASYWRAEGGRPHDGRGDRAGSFDAHIEEVAAKAQLPGVTKKGIHEWLLHRYPGEDLAGYNAFTQFMRKNGIAVGASGGPEPHPRFETPPGLQLQFDWKESVKMANRDGELFFTTDAARTFAKRIVDAGFDGIFVSISNPCDVVCTELWHLTGYDPKKIIGSGCGRDSARLRTEISKKVGVSPKSIDAYMIGEHGFSQLAAFKAATIAGKSLNELQAENPDKYAFDHMEVEELARKGGYVTYQGKQCTEYAVANSAARVCAAVLHNEHAVLSASTLMTGQYGEEGIFTSLPCVIGAEGVEEVYTLDLSEHELEGFHKSCQHIRDNIAQLDWWDAEAYDAK